MSCFGKLFVIFAMDMKGSFPYTLLYLWID